MKRLLVLPCIATLLSSCGTYRPEAFESKMARYQANLQGKNEVPEFKVAPYTATTNSRAPASVVNKSETENMSNKRLYFMTLFNQYNQLKKYVDKEMPLINNCPHFHSSIVEHSERYGKLQGDKTKNSIDWTKIDLFKVTSDDALAYYPEFLLPVDSNSTTPTVYDVLKKNASNEKNSEWIQKGLGIHLIKTHRELTELCEFGASDNYYVFENLITYSKDHGISKDTKGVQILLRSTIFSNMLLQESFQKWSNDQGRSPASVKLTGKSQNPTDYYGQLVYGRLSVEWVDEYVSTLTKQK